MLIVTDSHLCVAWRHDVTVGAELSDVSLVDFDRHLIRDFSQGRLDAADADLAWPPLCVVLLTVSSSNFQA